MVLILLMVFTVGCSSNKKLDEEMVTLELFDTSQDDTVIESKMETFFEIFGEKYEYSYSDNIIKFTIPKNKATEYMKLIEDEIELSIKNVKEEGYINSVDINDDFTEIEIDYTTAANTEIADKIGWYFINSAIAYQGFNGVLKDDVNVNIKSYIDGVQNNEINVNTELLN